MMEIKGVLYPPSQMKPQLSLPLWCHSSLLFMDILKLKIHLSSTLRPRIHKNQSMVPKVGSSSPENHPRKYEPQIWFQIPVLIVQPERPQNQGQSPHHLESWNPRTRHLNLHRNVFFSTKNSKKHYIQGVWSSKSLKFGKMRSKNPQVCPFTGFSSPFW